MQRILDLADRFEIYALCPPCGRMEALPCAALINRFGADVTITDLRPRLRCRQCGTRSGEIRVVYVGPEGRPATFRYRPR
jgi:hypothetical protein